MVVELRIGNLSRGALRLGQTGGVVSEPSGDDPRGVLVDDLVFADPSADQRDVALDVAEGYKRRSVVGGFDR